jgi:RNA polymerase sigma-70 factor (ECF subfamily)
MRLSNDDPSSIASLVKRSADGDVTAFSRLYELYRVRVFGFAVRMLGDSQMAEDIAHDTFMVLIEHPQKYSPERGSLITFLCAIARNQILLHWRRLGYQLEEQMEDEELVEIPGDTGRGPLTEILSRELSEKITAAIAQLPPLQREAIVLREYEGLAYQEIATITGSTVDMVRMRLRRARQSLSLRLGPYLNSGESSYELHRSTPGFRSFA